MILTVDGTPPPHNINSGINRSIVGGSTACGLRMDGMRGRPVLLIVSSMINSVNHEYAFFTITYLLVIVMC